MPYGFQREVEQLGELGEEKKTQYSGGLGGQGSRKEGMLCLYYKYK